MTNQLPATVRFEDQALSIVDHAGKPWLSSSDLARALKYHDVGKISRIYRAHKDEFTAEMQKLIIVKPKSGRTGVPTETRIFSPRGCHLVAMFARTSRAAAFRRWVLDVLEGLAKPVPVVQAAPTAVEILPPINGMITEAGKGLLAGHLLALLNRFGAMPQVVEEMERYGELPVPEATQNELNVLKLQTQLMARESTRLAQVAEGLANSCLGMRGRPLSPHSRKALADRAIADINRVLGID